MFSSVAYEPSSVFAALPGSTCVSTKMSTEMTNSEIVMNPSRLAR